MFILLVLAASILLALVRGGQLANLSRLSIRWAGIILIGFLTQIVIFSNYWQEKIEARSLTQIVYLASLGVLLAALAVNHAIPGMRLITFGFLFNLIAIALNGGYMPASPSALEAAGLPPLLPGQVSNNSIGIGSSTNLVFLCDVFAIPKELLFANVFSIGDVVIALGAAYLIQKAMVVPSPPSIT